MALSEAARRNHDELFPSRESALARTDPELIEQFGNFAATCDGTRQRFAAYGKGHPSYLQIEQLIPEMAGGYTEKGLPIIRDSEERCRADGTPFPSSSSPGKSSPARLVAG